MPIEEAKKTGAIALFSEKYGDVVRVVNIGEGYSVEFCGGTHLDNSAKAGLFHIESEFSVPSGRWVAVWARMTALRRSGSICALTISPVLSAPALIRP